MIALRYLRAKRQESFISVISGFSLLGIALGVATLIIVMSVMNGFRHELLKNILGLNGHVTVQSYALADFDAAAARIRAVPGVTRAAPVVDGEVMASQNGVNLGVVVRGLRREDLAGLTTVSSKLTPHALDNFDSGNEVIIGSGMATRLGLHIGSPITLIAPKGNVTPFGTTPRIKTYTVAGTFKVGMTQYDTSFIFMPLQEAQLFFNAEGRVSGIEVMVTDPDNDLMMLPRLAQAAGRDTRLVPWQDTNSSFFEALTVERNVMFLILTLIILVAALNIVSGLIMLVKDKGQDIAILRTMGASQGSIMRVFLITGAAIGVIGDLVGFLVGLLVCLNIESIRQFMSWLTNTELFSPELYFLSRLPADLDFGETTAVVVMALALSLLATLYPSWRAARLDPVEALRYE